MNKHGLHEFGQILFQQIGLPVVFASNAKLEHFNNFYLLTSVLKFILYFHYTHLRDDNRGIGEFNVCRSEFI